MDFKIIGKVINIKGNCAAGLNVGDEIDLTIPVMPEDYEGWKKKPKICPHLIPRVKIKKHLQVKFLSDVRRETGVNWPDLAKILEGSSKKFVGLEARKIYIT